MNLLLLAGLIIVAVLTVTSNITCTNVNEASVIETLIDEYSHLKYINHHKPSHQSHKNGPRYHYKHNGSHKQNNIIYSITSPDLSENNSEETVISCPTVPPVRSTPPNRIKSYQKNPYNSAAKLLFFDEFDEFDLKVWRHEVTLSGSGNYEFQYYVNNRSVSYVEESLLFIQPGLTQELLGIDELLIEQGFTLDIQAQCTQAAWFGCLRSSNGLVGGNIINPVTSARISTKDSFSFRYGRVEISARLPIGKWLWPAMWLLPSSEYYGIWPASGEIDLMEATGNDPSVWSSTIHYAPNYPEYAYNLHKQTCQLNGKKTNFHDDFHVYGLVWTEKELYSYIDQDRKENRIMHVEFNQDSFTRGKFNKTLHNPWINRPANAPFDQDFYLLLNLAVGGVTEFFPDSPCKPWENSSPHSMNEFWAAREDWLKTWRGEDSALQVDWIAVWDT
jgi:hypothetical protein